PTKRHNPAARRRTAALFVLVAVLIAAMLVVAFALRGGPTVTVPGVRGATRETVLQRMRRAHLAVHFVKRYSRTVRAGTAISQEPRPGRQVDKDGTVTVVLSRGLAPVKVPPLVDLSDADARHLLGEEGLHARVIPGPDPGVAAGTVYKQDPGANRKARAHSTVTLDEAEAPTWQAPITSFSGSGYAKSVVFQIRGTQWRIVYSMGYGGACDVLFFDEFCSGPTVVVQAVPSGRTVAKFAMNEGADQTYVIHAGKGDYQITVTPGNSAGFAVKAEDYF